ncbi:MAG: hypothetical protein [Wendovervirus sonii]|uniref:Uncharacterized protein n=1 Tax=phage Lak_Megaphage_Sonny TaxID=3109229 RepID=A0ABZ0Z6D7_9CAUD|nr:MAG: hypothetical protein [phage Lak_Megaphage_Sonny]
MKQAKDYKQFKQIIRKYGKKHESRNFSYAAKIYVSYDFKDDLQMIRQLRKGKPEDEHLDLMQKVFNNFFKMKNCLVCSADGGIGILRSVRETNIGFFYILETPDGYTCESGDETIYALKPEIFNEKSNAANCISDLPKFKEMTHTFIDDQIVYEKGPLK